MFQQTLTGEYSLILDATCSAWKVFPAIADIRLDISLDAKPDIVASAEYLPFRDNIFTIIYCDPPHMIGKGVVEKPKFSRYFSSINRHRKGMARQYYLHCMGRYGRWNTKDDWIRFLGRTNLEFYRCLISSGKLIYKLCEVKGGVKFKDLEYMDKFNVSCRGPSIGRIQKFRRKSNLGKNQTRYFELNPV